MAANDMEMFQQSVAKSEHELHNMTAITEACEAQEISL
jgi:hypothetical protein